MPVRTLFALSGMLLVVGLAIGCQRGNKYAPPPPPEVTVRVPKKKSVQTYLEYSGIIRAIDSVELPARVKGVLKERLYQEGGLVKADQLLLVIDESEYTAKLEAAEATLAEANANLQKAITSKAREVATAQLALDRASLLLAQIEQSRQRSLLSRNAASQQDIDRADATTKKSQAQVEADDANLAQAKSSYDVDILSAKASIASAESKLKIAQLDLSYCRIKAPVAGRVSRTLQDVGNLVGDANSQVLATLLREDQVYCYISLSESDILRFRSMRAAGDRPDFMKETIPLDLGMMNENGFPHKGKVQYADPGVDSTTGTVVARGIFDNPDGNLTPGAYARVRVPFETKKDALLIPEEAIGSDSQGRYVLVVNDKNIVERRGVQLGSQAENERVVESGLLPMDRVIVRGIQKARPDSPVKPIEVPLMTTTSAASEASSKNPGKP